MEINEKELEERKGTLEKEISQLHARLQEANQAMQLIPIHIATRQGEIIGINRLLNQTKPEIKKK